MTMTVLISDSTYTDNVLGKLNVSCAYITDIDNCVNYMRLVQEPRFVSRRSNLNLPVCLTIVTISSQFLRPLKLYCIVKYASVLRNFILIFLYKLSIPFFFIFRKSLGQISLRGRGAIKGELREG